MHCQSFKGVNYFPEEMSERQTLSRQNGVLRRYIYSLICSIKNIGRIPAIRSKWQHGSDEILEKYTSLKLTSCSNFLRTSCLRTLSCWSMNYRIDFREVDIYIYLVNFAPFYTESNMCDSLFASRCTDLP